MTHLVAPLAAWASPFFSTPHCYAYTDGSMTIKTTGNHPTLVILDPSVYMTKIVELPVQHPKEALLIAPSFFEECSAGCYYHALLLGGQKFLLIAVDRNTLATRLNVNFTSSVAGYITAHEAFSSLPLSLDLGHGSVLTHVDGALVKLPLRYVKDGHLEALSSYLDRLSPYALSARIRSLATGGLKPATLRRTLLALSIIWVNLMALGWLIHNDTKKLQDDLDTMMEKEHLPKTQIERDTKVESLKKIEDRQLQLRHTLGVFSKLPFHPHPSTTEPTRTPPQAMANPSATSGVVLIPGSKPEDRNLLIVNGETNASSLTPHKGTAALTSLIYDGSHLTFSLQTSNPQETTMLKEFFQKRLPSSRLSGNETTLDGEIKQ